MKPRVLIIDSESYDTLPEMPGVFSRAGYMVDVLCAKKSWLRRNRFVNTWIPASADKKSFVQQIIDCAKSGTYSRIIAGDDATIRLVNELLPDNDPVAPVILPLSKMEYREMLGSKVGLAQVCNRLGIVTPKTMVCMRNTYRDAVESIGFPLVIKTDVGHTGLGVAKCANHDDILRVLEGMGQRETFLVQEYISGDIINTESLFDRGRLMGYAYSKTIRNVTGEFGVSAVRAYYANSMIEPVLQQIGDRIGISGFVNMTFMRDHAGNHYLIEADPRPQAWVSMARFAGVDFSIAIQNQTSPLTPLLQGEGNRTIRPTIGTPENPIIIRHFSRDLMRCIIARDWQGIWDWVRNKDGRWKFIPWYDPVLVFWMWGRVVKFWWRRR